MSMEQDDDMAKEFLVESFENLDRLDQELVQLESDPEDVGVLNSIFRTIHTIKGTCGFFNYTNLEGLAHVGENLLDSLRSGKKKVTPEITSVLLQLSDATREILTLIEKTGNSGENEYGDLKVLLAHHNKVGCPAPVVVESQDPLEEEFNRILAEREALEALATDDENDQVLENEKIEINEIVEKIEVVQPTIKPIEVVAAKNNNPPEENKKKEDTPLADSSIRVDVNLLDDLMNLVGELVLARNQLRQFTATQQDQTFLTTFQRLNLITAELQEGVMKTRMQPIMTVWNKFPRVVRDVSISCGKKVRLEMEGKETELDKTIIEAIKDPLVHIVRNAIDHGIETPDKRLLAGKPEEGVLLLRAFHEGGYVILEIADDGAGLNRQRIKAKAIERGLITEEKAKLLSDAEVRRLIFLPGFSTAEQITNISGRGVGMDVVRINVERIGGTLDIESDEGQGSRIRIKIPLTLAIVPALIVSSNNETFAIPQVSLVELVRLDSDAKDNGLENINGAQFYRLRGILLPLVHLRSVLKFDNENANIQNHKANILNVVVVRSEMRIFGLVVDSVHDTEEIVVKSLTKNLKSIGVYAGATIMGDGRVALILDVMNIAQRSQLVGHKNGVRNEDSIDATTHDDSLSESLLIVEIGSDTKAAIPLDSVRRLEEFEFDKVGNLNGNKVIQYRGGILDLFELQSLFPYATSSEDDERRCHVVVLNTDDRQVGFVVEKILDVVRQRVEIGKRATIQGSRGAAIVQGDIMEVLDLHELANHV
jgi:two-component system, chemotaxis family, sensor kinase CheA